MNCYNKQCKYKELNGEDKITYFYFCKYAETEVGRGKEECLIDEFERETEEQIEIYTCSDCGKQFPSICNSAPYKDNDLCINCLTKN